MLAPVAAVATILIAYGLHHVSPLDGHSVGVTLVIVAAAALLVGIFRVLAPDTEQRLPVIVTLRRDSFRVRELRTEELDFAVALHAETLPHGFFAELGPRFLRAYLATFVSSPHAVALAVEGAGSPLGTVVGILRPSAHARWTLRHHGVRLALLGVLALFVRPRLAIRFARTRLARYRRAWARRSGGAPVASLGEPAVLSHLAVVPGAQGAGLGGGLVEAFVEAVRATGCRRIVLVTLAGPRGAAGFYERLGWTEAARRTGFDGEPLTELTLELEAEPA